MVKSIQAVFWDYDNTILSTAEAHWKKHQIALAKEGIQLDEMFRCRIYENNGYQNWAWMKGELGLKIPEKEYLQIIDEEFHRYIDALEMRPGVPELFDMFKRLKIPQAIITNSRRASAEPVLRSKKIMPFMEFVLFKEDYEGRKPDPSPYLAGFKKMEVMTGYVIEPKRCIAIEDDPKGVESASKAGAIVIHRRLREDEPSSSYAEYSCFNKNEFVKIVENLIL